MQGTAAVSTSYADAWNRYRWWSRAFWAIFLLYLPALTLLNRALGGGERAGGTVAMAAIVWLIAFAVAGYFKWNFACPRCGELFFKRFDDRVWRRDWIVRPFAHHCLHCGLAKWAAADDRSSA